MYSTRNPRRASGKSSHFAAAPAIPRKPRLISTIRIVAHNTHKDAISIDGNSPLAYPLWRYRDADREFHVEKFNKLFYSRLNTGVHECVDAVEQLIATWQKNKVLLLAHDKPDLPNHGHVIAEYECFELRRRGLAEDYS